MQTEKERLDVLEPIVADLSHNQSRLLGYARLLTDQVALHSVKIDELLERSNRQENRTEKIATGLANLTLDVAALRTEMRVRFEAIDQRFEAIDRRLDNLESNVSAIRQTQDAILLLLKEKLK